MAPPTSRTHLPKLGDRLPLGPDRLQVSPFCLGVVAGPETVLAAYAAGINFFFVSADMHWPVYEPLRRGLQLLFAQEPGARDRVVVAGVSYLTQPEFCMAPFLEVLADVPGLGQFDLTVVGGSYGRDFLPRLDAYGEHRLPVADGGLGARAVAASFHDRRAAAFAVRHGAVDLAFVRYNPMHDGAETDFFPEVSAARSTLVYNFNSTFGHLAPGRYAELGVSPTSWRPTHTDYYRFALSQPAVDGLLCSLRTPEHIAAVAAACERGPLTEQERQYLTRLAELDRGDVVIS